MFQFWSSSQWKHVFMCLNRISRLTICAQLPPVLSIGTTEKSVSPFSLQPTYSTVRHLHTWIRYLLSLLFSLWLLPSHTASSCMTDAPVRWLSSLGAQWRPHQSSDVPGWLKECYLAFGTMVRCLLFSKQTKDDISVRTSCPHALFTPDLDQLWWSLHVIEIGCPGNLFPSEASKIFKCSIGVCPDMKWSNEDYVIRWFWNTALMKNSKGNAFFCSLPVHLVCSWRKEMIILGSFNVWDFKVDIDLFCLL